MCRIKFLIILFCFFASSAHAEKINIMLGIPGFYNGKKEIYESLTHKFFIKKDDYDFRLLSDFLTKKLDIVILSPEYLLKASWGVEESELIYKTFPHYVYLMSSPGTETITKKNIKGKTILVRNNSQEEFYLRRFAGQDNIVILKAQMKQVEIVVNSGFMYQGQKVDAIAVDAESYYQNRKKAGKVSYIQAGNYYVLTLLQNNWILKTKENNEVIKNLIMPMNWPNKIDVKEMVELNNFLVKKASAQKMFEVFYHNNLRWAL